MIAILWPAVAALAVVLLYRAALRIEEARRAVAGEIVRIEALEVQLKKQEELLNRVDVRTRNIHSK